MEPGQAETEVELLTVRHHFLIPAVPFGSGVAVAAIEPRPEKVELSAVVHEVVGSVAAPAEKTGRTAERRTVAKSVLKTRV